MEWKFATTLIGSLPHGNEKEAVDLILSKKIDIPSWPQLPKKGFVESMYCQTGEKLPGLMTRGDKLSVDLSNYDPEKIFEAIIIENEDYFEYGKDKFFGFHEFVKRDLSEYAAVKGQVTGAISEGLQVLDIAGRSVIYDESYAEIVRHAVNLSARWQAKKLSEKNKNVIMFFDEPSMTMLGTPFVSISNENALLWTNESMEGVNAFKAIHCCGNTNWELILSSNIDILSFDAYQFSENVIMFSKELEEFYGRGGSIAWGIVPTSDENIEKETAESLYLKMVEIISKLEKKGIDGKLVASRSILTPQCGLGTTSLECTEKALDMLVELSHKLKEKYGY